MSILDTIESMATGTYTFTRRGTGTFVNGKYVQNPTATTFTAKAVVQPATDLQRVVGGEDMRSYVENQRMDDVRMLHIAVELHARTATRDPDIMHMDGDEWTVFRVESWNYYGDQFWMAVVTRKTDGAA